jgi:AcrR family transcriptional regulator
VPRTPDPEKRAELLRAVVAYLERNGLAELSLSPLAEELGSSKRMLLYYFGSRERLLGQALAAARPDAQAMFGEVRDRDGLRSAAEALWRAITVGEQQAKVRMLLQLLSLSTTQPAAYGELAADAVEVMIRPIADAFTRLGHPPADARTRATLLVSALRGLCQDRLVTRDTARVDAAARRIITDATGRDGT